MAHFLLRVSTPGGGAHLGHLQRRASVVDDEHEAEDSHKHQRGGGDDLGGAHCAAVKEAARTWQGQRDQSVRWSIVTAALSVFAEFSMIFYVQLSIHEAPPGLSVTRPPGLRRRPAP